MDHPSRFKMLLLFVAFLAISNAQTNYNGSYVSVFARGSSFELQLRSNGKQPFLEGEYAFGKFSDTMEIDGWTYLDIHTNPALADNETSLAAGFLEGYTTADRMEQYWNNMQMDQYILSKKARTEYLEVNQEFIKTMVNKMIKKEVPDEERAYWWQVNLIYQQLQGLFDGYKSAKGNKATLTYESMLFMTLQNELYDIIDAYGGSYEGLPNYSHCSALIKLAKNNSDVFISQTTWSGLTSMMRIYKLYDFDFLLDGTEASGRVPATRMSFPSYFGTLYSGDDFYQMSTGIISMETTIDFYANDLNQYILPNTVSEWARNMIANRLATTGQDWVEIFSMYNSGTYNNAWMIFNMNLFVAGKLLVENTFWLLEQNPGYIVTHDMSSSLQQDQYYASYNVIQDSYLRAYSGTDRMENDYGSYYSYVNTSRALIFKRGVPDVVDMPSMKLMMRYNNYPNDPLSSQIPTCLYVNKTDCNPALIGGLSIAARCDLQPKDGVYAFWDLEPSAEAAIDAKITSFSTFNLTTLVAQVQSGPTYDDLPPFQWSTSQYHKQPHVGMPDLWQFPWLSVGWESTQ